jgi:predicted regulator of Ras-like GTPase activity (Roadblock/LC7/MglB family)
VQRARETLERRASDIKGLRAALVVTPDGFEVASVERRTMNRAHLSALASSLMAMAQAVGRELAIGAFRRMVFDAAEGTVVLQPVAAEFPVLLCVVLDQDAVLGHVMWAMGEMSNELSL